MLPITLIVSIPIAAFLAVIIFLRPFFGILVFAFLIPFESAFLGLSGGSASVLRFLGIYIFIVWIGWVFLTRHRIKMPFVALLAALFFLWAGASALWAADKSIVFASLLTGIQLLVLLWMIVDQVNGRKRLKEVLLALGSGCLMITLMGLLGVGVESGSNLLTLVNQGAKEYGIYVGMVFLFGTILLVFSKGRNRVAGFVLTGISSVALFLIAERGVFLAIGLAWIALGISSRQRLRIILGIVFLALILYFVPPILVQQGILQPSVADRLTIQDLLRTGGTGRTQIWGGGFKMFMDNPIFGVGLSNAKMVFYHYIGYLSASHNDWLSVSDELGVIGLLIFITIQIIIGYRLVRLISKSANLGKDIFVVTVFTLFIYTLACGLTSDVMWFKIYWYILALAILLPQLILKWDSPSLSLSKGEAIEQSI